MKTSLIHSMFGSLRLSTRHLPTSFQCPRRMRSKQCSVIVATCAMVGNLIESQRVSKNQFTHILIDESSTAMEAEVMIPISLASRSTRTILVGDHKQLGAQVLDPQARTLGLEMSLQERLMESPDLPYSRGDNRYLACLSKNYRSHEVILKIPNELFYGGILESAGDRKIIDSMCYWQGLPKKNFPLLFVGVEGKEAHDLDEPTFSNHEEATKIAQYVEGLVKMDNANQNDIGIIALFRAQVMLVRKRLRSMGLGAVRVGTVDDYQGQEEKIIIISTVLVNKKWLTMDESHPVLDC